MPVGPRLLAVGGEDGTSFRLPFPGCPGLSQSHSPQVFHAHGASTVPSKNGRHRGPARCGCHGFVLHKLLTERGGE